MTGHIRRRGERSWEIKFDLGTDPATGKRLTRYASVKGTKREAEKELTRLLHDVEQGTLLEPTKMTVGEYLVQWLATTKHKVSATTHEGYGWIVNKHLIPALGIHPIGKLAPLHVQRYYSAALETGKRRNGKGALSAQTVKHHHRVLSEALRQAVRLRIIARNPCDDIDPPRVPRREIAVIDQAKAAELITAVEGTPLYAPILLAVTTGMRRGELLGLRWKDLDLDRRSLSVAQCLEQTTAGLAFKAPKTARSRRTITLPAITVEGLRRHRVHQAEGLLRLGVRATEDTLVCTREDGSPMPPSVLSDGFRRLAKRLRLSVRLHGLRHSHITHLLAAGVHPKVASERAGHASVSITLDIYSHVVEGMQEDAASRIDAALRTHLER